MGTIIRDIGKVGLFIYKILIYIITVITLPIFIILKKKNSVLYFSTVNWKWIKQRPHFVALNLCNNGYDVDYYFDKQYEKYDKSNSSNLVNNDVNNKRLSIKSWEYFPSKNIKSMLNKFIFVTRTFFINYDKVIFTHPKQIEYLNIPILKLRNIKIYYECMDNYIFWEQEKFKNSYEKREQKLLTSAKNIIVSSKKLKELMINKYDVASDKVIVIRNGYDKHTFDNAEESDLEIKNPCALYIGTIEEWLDLDAITKYAEKNKKVYIYLIGPVAETIDKQYYEKKYKNIIFTGPIEHKYVPSVVDKGDIMLLPFKVNELIECVDPVKLYEYLYKKKKIVSSYWKELNQFDGLVDFYKNENDFNEIINKTFKKEFKINKKYEKIVFESNWDERLKKYLDVIK